MKQKTMHVESSPSDNSDAEAVSASSTKFRIKTRHLGGFFVRSIINSALDKEKDR